MARMHSRKKGKSASKKPLTKTKKAWVTHGPKEVEMLILKLAKEEKSASEIGLILRDSYGVPSVKDITGKSITKIMKEKKVAPEIPEDLLALIRKSISLRNHLEENKQDKTALRGLQLTESKIRRMVTYYKLNKKLPLTWKYDAKSIKVYAE